MTQTISISFFRFDRWQDRLWAMSMMVAARAILPRVADIGFWKLCGSGAGVGFDVVPNPKVFAILATWPDAQTAQARTSSAGIFQRYVKHASETWTVFLNTTSVRGQWAGSAPFDVSGEHHAGPLAVLTRATIKTRNVLRFWQRVPDISAVIGDDPNVMFKIGIGEAPLLNQITFSVWPDAHSMAEFARRDGPHARAIRSVRDESWFKEELYARFTIVGDRGTWGGSSPLTQTERPA
ncbi:spheroidene monooxygenase [Ascidiaceihabitans sp.]|uniref:spheroidene monooxygenase n=1 Tax=Ascidiaceihabitans sp. TaxID=1872644 RepID=UPI00329890D5